MSRIGRSASAITSSRASDVSGTSAVGIAHRSSRSRWYASSTNFGRCPVLTIVSVRTSVGGRISSKASLFRSSANWMSARLSLAPGAAEHREHRARELRRALEIEDAELRADVPVRHPLMRAVLVRVVADDAEHDVVLGAAAVGRVLGREVRRREQDRPQLVADGLDLAVELALVLAERSALGLQCLGGRRRRPPCAAGRRRATPSSPGCGSRRAASASSRSRRSSSMARSISVRSSPRRASAAFTPSGSARRRRMSIMWR